MLYPPAGALEHALIGDRLRQTAIGNEFGGRSHHANIPSRFPCVEVGEVLPGAQLTLLCWSTDGLSALTLTS